MRYLPLLLTIYAAQTADAFLLDFWNTVGSFLFNSGTRNCRKKAPTKVAGACQLNTTTAVKVDYDTFGILECGKIYALRETQSPPILTLSTANSNKLYTVLLVDTTESAVHPILHFGSVNVPGERLRDGIDLSLENESAFSAYRGPSPPFFVAFIPIVRRQPINYEYIIAEQVGQRDEKTSLDSNLNFDYEEFLDIGRSSTIGALYSTYFASGFCVNSLF